MPIVNFRIRKIEAKKEGELEKKGGVNVKSNFTISSIKRTHDKKVGDYLLVNFKFDVGYEPNLGSIILEGELWYQSKELNKIVNEKDDKIFVKGEASNEISTTILQNSILESIEIARKIRLPVPIKLPKVEMKQEKMPFDKAS